MYINLFSFVLNINPALIINICSQSTLSYCFLHIKTTKNLITAVATIVNKY